MASIIGIQPGRSWEVDRVDREASGSSSATNTGVSAVTRVYLIQRTSADVHWDYRDEATYQSLQGFPKIGDVHHVGDDVLRVKKISFQEGSGSDKMIVKATVTYGRDESQQPESSAGAGDACSVESWGWHSGSVQRDLMQKVTENNILVSKPIVNSAGDPFDSVPQVDFPSPTFTKVFKTKTRLADAVGFQGSVNASAITIGERQCAALTLRCVQADEDRIFNDAQGFLYRYSISLQYMSNMVKINGVGNPVEIGWDAAVADTGLRAKEYPGGGGEEVLVRCMDDDDNGNKTPCSVPVGLDGTGHRSADGVPVFLRFQAYDRAAFPVVFTSEPDENGVEEDENDGTL